MKRLLLILTLVCFVISGWAEQITREQALRKAQQFLSQKGLPSSVKAVETQMSRRRAQGISQPDYYYVFNNGQNQGFVIISGDDRAETVLGYATSGHFDVDSIPPAMADLLNYYSYQIEAIKHGASIITRAANHPQVPNLMTVKWDQEEPYNNMAPLGYYVDVNDGSHCVTGCVATAMAQVLYHQHFVNATQATIPGYQNKTCWQSPSGVKYAQLADVSAGSALDWNNMVDNYYVQTTTQDQKNAVANLMLYCGTAVNMNYDLEGSSAPVYAIPDAFKKYFGYSRGTRYVQRESYSDTEWDNLIYNEIASGRPVIYGGQTAENEGHAFVVHGYDGNGKYAINWGWGGYQDNYFFLNNLTPDDQGTGGGSGGYNYGQEAVIYLAKEDGTFSEIVKATVTGVKIGDFKISDGYLVMPTQTEYSADRDYRGTVEFSLAISYSSRLANTYTMDFGYGILNSSGQLVGDVNQLNSREIKNGVIMTFGTGTNGFGEGLSVGNYYIKAYSREKTASEWLLCDDADKYAVSLTVTDKNMSFKVIDISTPEPDPEVTDADREELITSYTTLKNSVEAKQTAVAENENKIASLKTALNEKKKFIATIETTINSINTKLTNNTYLSESQKNEFLVQLTTLNNQLVQLKNDLSALESTLTTLESSNASLKTQLNELLSQISKQLGSIAGITTKEALNASKVLVAQLTTTGTGYDVNGVTTQISGVETSLNGITFTKMQTSLSDLDKSVDKAIADAATAALEEQERKELEAAKASMKETIEGISKSALNKAASVEANNKSIDALKATIASALETAKSVSDKIADIKILLEDKYISEAQKKDYLLKLEKYEKELEEYQESLEIVSSKLDDAEKSNASFATKLEEVNKAIADLIVKVDATTKIDDVEALKPETEIIVSHLEGVDATSISKDLDALAAQLKTLSLSEISTAIEELQKVIRDLIDTAKSDEEKEKQEAEKLAKAQEAFKTAIDALDEAIKSQEVNYNKCLDVMDNIKAKMAELNGAISQMKAKYAEIEKKLQELIDKQSNTRAGDSEVIENLQKKLAELKENIETLESQSALIAGHIETLEQQAKDYAAVINTAKTSRQTLYDALSSATTADEVDKLTASVNKAKLDLASEGTGHYNLLAKNCKAVTDKVSDVVDNVNVVDKTIKIVEMQVEEVVTAINQLIIDESEVVARYDMKGNPVDSTYKGVQIIKLKNGKTIKLYVK